MSLPILFDAALASALASQIDGCEFGTVKRYFRSPTTEIGMVVLVAPPYALEEVAAVFATPHAQDGEVTLRTLLTAGVLKFGVDNDQAVHPAERDNTVLLDRIGDARACRVIYLPPCYVVQLAAEPHLSRRVRRQQEDR